jgi:dipeptidyl aminopeptidase/acylaminoacyl peptidase
MPDLSSRTREVFEMTTKQVEPKLDSWKEQQDRQRHAARNRRMGTFAVVAAILAVVAVVAVFVVSNPSVEKTTPGGSSTGPASPGLTPGLDPQARSEVSLDGTTLGTVPGLPEDAFALSLSANGQTIAFVTDDQGVNSIATIGFDGSNVRILGPGIQPAMSPDGTRIAFVRDNDIYVMNADGSGVQRVVANPHVDEFPQWSPDGTTIAYDHYAAAAPTDSGFSEDSSILVVPVAGGSPTEIAKGGAAGEPSYSPDGTRIAFRRDNGIWVMNADGSDPHAIAADVGVVDGVRWSSDGTKIAFSSYNGDWRANLHLGTDSGEWAVGDVRYVDVNSGDVSDVGITIATFYNAPNWLPTSDALLVNAVRQG